MDKHTWSKVINLVQEMYVTGMLPQRLSMSNLILIPKGNNEMRGIGLVEGLWKVLGKIINKRITEVVEFHPSVHGFREKKELHWLHTRKKLCIKCSWT